MILVALDCPDPRSLAEFYRGVLGGDGPDDARCPTSAISASARRSTPEV
ncbi:VOC family protein [[Kitasatospora] papulosa]